MILSFHPLISGHRNILCAGRKPGPDDLDAVRQADVVILPIGCAKELYCMARNNCRRVFPNYDARFSYPGKIGQIHLFRKADVPHPGTETCTQIEDLYAYINSLNIFEPLREIGFFEKIRFLTILNSQFSILNSFPFVFKFDWGGEGDNVFLINSAGEFEEILEKAAAYEKTGQAGFLIQEYIPSDNRTLRVVVIGEPLSAPLSRDSQSIVHSAGRSIQARASCGSPRSLGPWREHTPTIQSASATA